MKTTFNKLPDGAIFKFASEVDMPHWSGARGPWEKLGSRTYQAYPDGGPVHTVGRSGTDVYLHANLQSSYGLRSVESKDIRQIDHLIRQIGL